MTHTSRTARPLYALFALVLACFIGVNGGTRIAADVISDCVGKPYGSAGCPTFAAASSSSFSVSRTCGNSIVEAGEQCDNGKNRNGVSNCDTSCRLLECGDGVVSPAIGEECEPIVTRTYALDPSGSLTVQKGFAAPSCGPICTVPTIDAKGVSTGGCMQRFQAACVASSSAQAQALVMAVSSSSAPAAQIPAAAPSSSSASSVPAAASVSSAVPRCGDGVLQPTLGEQCDDGNAIDDDACTAACKMPRCGDGIEQQSEQCDDGNRVDADGCSNACLLPACGDGSVQPGEQCDDGNKDDVDGCSNSCKLPRCGDGLVQASAGELCDDGNTINTDKCTNQCDWARCGDGITQATEQCDDGNRTDTDGCSNQCERARCGDGVLQPATGEQCDDGNRDGTDGCSALCKLPHCGNGTREVGEECDDGNAFDDDACTDSCALPRCGDGTRQTGEQCDDGNRENGDGCGSTCKVERCGDGIVQPSAGEQCDSGPLNSDASADTCRTACKNPRCGDHVVDTGEQCDGTDDCDANCQVLKPAAPVASTDPTWPVIAVAAGASLIVVAGYVFKSRLLSLAGAANESVASVSGKRPDAVMLDEIPLDEIEMAWHK
jgi:cysteine-rich repeat protein